MGSRILAGFLSVAGGLGVFGALAICALGVGFLFVIPALGGATLLGGLLIAGFALGGAGNAHEALMKGVEQHVAEPMKRKQLATVEPLRQYVAELAELRHALGTPAGQIASLPG